MRRNAGLLALHYYHVFSNWYVLLMGLQVYKLYHCFRLITSMNHQMIMRPIQIVQLLPINPDELKTISITSNGSNQPPEMGWVTTAPLNESIHGGVVTETHGHTGRITDIQDDEYKSKTIPTTQLSVTTSPSTYNGGSDLTPQCQLSKTKGKDDRRFRSRQCYDYLPFNWVKCTYLSIVCISTALATSKKLTCSSILQPTYSYSYLMRTICPWQKDPYCHERLQKRSASMETTLYHGSTLRMWSFPSIDENL